MKSFILIQLVFFLSFNCFAQKTKKQLLRIDFDLGMSITKQDGNGLILNSELRFNATNKFGLGIAFGSNTPELGKKNSSSGSGHFFINSTYHLDKKSKWASSLGFGINLYSPTSAPYERELTSFSIFPIISYEKNSIKFSFFNSIPFNDYRALYTSICIGYFLGGKLKR